MVAVIGACCETDIYTDYQRKRKAVIHACTDKIGFYNNLSFTVLLLDMSIHSTL